MSQTQVLSVEPPRFEARDPFKIVGLEKLFTADTRPQIPELWQRAAEIFQTIPDRSDRRAYGVIQNTDSSRGFRYLAGVEVAATASVPPGLDSVMLDAGTYLVFTHRQHVSKLFETMCAIYRDWLPQSQVALADAPCFELYGEGFDPHKGVGLIEIWLPLESDDPAMDSAPKT